MVVRPRSISFLVMVSQNEKIHLHQHGRSSNLRERSWVISAHSLLRASESLIASFENGAVIPKRRSCKGSSCRMKCQQVVVAASIRAGSWRCRPEAGPNLNGELATAMVGPPWVRDWDDDIRLREHMLKLKHP